jgi:hypothetical protein
MPRHPSPHPEGWSLDFPQAPGSVHYVTFNHGPLTGKSLIRMRYRIEVDEGTTFVNNLGGDRALLSLYFQRRGDNWTAQDRYGRYRWYIQPGGGGGEVRLAPGEREVVARFDESWMGALGSGTPAEFSASLANAECVGFVFGGGDGLGHGVHATGSARFVLLDFRVE